MNNLIDNHQEKRRALFEPSFFLGDYQYYTIPGPLRNGLGGGNVFRLPKAE